MGWLSPVKGHYPSLSQVDKTLPVKTGVTAIKRGTILALISDDEGKSEDGVWKIATSTDKLLYVSLQDYSDPTAGFAGTAFDPAGGVPAITGIDLAQEGEYETSVFDTSKTYVVGQPLYVDNGVLTNAGSGTVVGYVTRPSTDRWINNAIALPDQSKGETDPRLAIRTGAKQAVLRFRTAA